MAKKTNLIRKNVFISDQVNNWLEQESEKTGLSQSAIMSMAISTYMRQQETPHMINDLKSLFEQMQSMEQKEKGEDQGE